MKKIYFLLLALFLFTGVNAQIINFPDANFKAKLLLASSSNTVAMNFSGSYFKIDANNNGQIEVNEALLVKELNLSNSTIASLQGINNFLNLQKLDCSYNQLSAIDISSLTSLLILYCHNNSISNLNLSNNNNLTHLGCSYNNLTNLNVLNLANLNQLYCTNNNLTNLNISNLVNLEAVVCSSNQLSQLNISGSIKIRQLECYYNQITSLNLNEIGLGWIGVPVGYLIDCRYNNLNSIYTKNGLVDNFSMMVEGNPNLSYVCCDENEIDTAMWTLFYYSSSYTVNSYCSFTPGGIFYTIQGNNKLDNNNDGCDASDLVYPNLNFTITDGTLTGNIISNISGGYSLPVGQGTHTISPVIENPTYFNITPSTINVTFPTQTSPFNQNFCITPNGIHQDLEVILLPTVPARPGFDAVYKIIFKNKGTNVQSGSVNLTFNDAVLDFVSANPASSSQTINNLSWDFINLQPFETREITLTLNVNSPMETPPVNIGNQLDFDAIITPITGDEIPIDNTSGLKQIVVGSLDPNDKTCLEGTTVLPSMIGEYVHYMIRFENTGTYLAENVVVKDMIDTNKFDINTLIPIKGSHPFVTNISSGNKVEYIFENINLPFDNANNDGYIAFKIKTKSNLVVGDTFTNNASIYFDYNFPIVTNTATTTIQALAIQDFEFSDYFTLYPNPVKETLNLSVKNGIGVISINIYNTLGQIVLAVPNAQTISNIDVSKLTTGNYFIKMNTDKGTSNTRFVKN